MSRSAIQFQKGLSLPEFLRLYGTEEQCEAALEKARWPDGFRCPRCQSHEHGLVYGRRLKRYQCRTCGHQATITAGTIMQATKLSLTTWFQAFYLIGQAKTGISSLELSRHLGVNYDTAWLLHNKILRAMTEREEADSCQATSKTAPHPTPKTEPPPNRSGASFPEWFLPGCAGGASACSWFS